MQCVVHFEPQLATLTPNTKISALTTPPPIQDSELSNQSPRYSSNIEFEPHLPKTKSFKLSSSETKLHKHPIAFSCAKAVPEFVTSKRTTTHFSQLKIDDFFVW